MDASFLSGANAVYIGELYAAYLKNPAEVDDSWAGFFRDLGDEAGDLLKELDGASLAPSDATIIGAPSSTKNAQGKRDPEMHKTRKGEQWFFGMKLHIGVDSKTGLAHSAVVTSANVHDKHALPDLMHGAETHLYGDCAYA